MLMLLRLGELGIESGGVAFVAVCTVLGFLTVMAIAGRR